MKRDEALQKLKEWFDSGEAAALIDAYPQNHVIGTYGTQFQSGPKPAVIGDNGVLLPERFREYMAKVQGIVGNALRGVEIEHHDVRTVNFLRETLEQMYDSVSLPSNPVRVGARDMSLGEIFRKGKEMGGVLRECFPVVDIGSGVSGQTRGSGGGMGGR